MCLLSDNSRCLLWTDILIVSLLLASNTDKELVMKVIKHHGAELAVRYPPGVPEYEAYRAELQVALEKFRKREVSYDYPLCEETEL